jgi:hypothetical protein
MNRDGVALLAPSIACLDRKPRLRFDLSAIAGNFVAAWSTQRMPATEVPSPQRLGPKLRGWCLATRGYLFLTTQWEQLQLTRPLLQKSIQELEVALAARKTDVSFLHTLLDELCCRSTHRAARLKTRVEQVLAEIDGPAEHLADSKSPREADELPFEDSACGPYKPTNAPPLPASPDPISTSPIQYPPVSNEPIAILGAWTALEVLSPSTFRQETDLTGGDRSAIAKLEGPQMPWQQPGGGRKSYRLYYQVVLGTIKFDDAVTALLAKYSDTRPERPRRRGEAVLASIMLDRSGKPIDEPAVTISSFAWGVPKALAGDVAALGEWQSVHQPLLEQLDHLLRREDADGELIALDMEIINAAHLWLLRKLDLPPTLVRPPRFAIRNYQYYRNSEAPEPLLLNSFFLGDLSRAMSLWRSGTAPPNLRRYLGTERPRARSDLLQDHEALRQAVVPSMFPLARWPGAGRHPLVLLQQAAVNLATHTLAEDGILAVNGPPGTGKTTLLRDVVAALVTERAEVMASFDDPASAFTNSGQRISAGNAWLHLYRLDEKLKGFEMLVASSNNKAVENVSAELPGLNAIADDATDLRYFKAVSDGLLERDTWGLVAAVLGNAQNRSAFRQRFWWDSELGLSTYLAHASGTPQIVDVLNERGEIIGQRPPLIVTQEDPPRDTRDALQRWQRARRAFRATLERSRDARQDLQAVHQFQMSMPSLV